MAVVNSSRTSKSKSRSSTSQEITFLATDACLYSVVKRSASALGWKLIEDNFPDEAKRNCDVIWIDRSFVADKLFLSLEPWQRINHFPGMTNICRKTRLAANLEIMRKQFPKEFSFYPQTFILPQQLGSFKALFVNGQSKKPLIIKPDGAAQGKGIFLTKRLEEVESLQMSCVAQQIISNPLLIDNKKFDLRIYVLVTSCNPLRCYLFRDGLVRMCTEEYKRPNSSNLADRCMHLTNYAVNKRSDKYEREDSRDDDPSGQGSKRSISWLMSWLRVERGEEKANEMWSKIGDICAMTIISILPTLQREYASIWRQPDCETVNTSRCFEILGIDVMIDKTLRPHLIEVNHLPSWGTDSELDDTVKKQVITQALRAINVKASDRCKFTHATKTLSRMRLEKQAIDAEANEEHEHTSQAKASRKPSLFESNSAERKIRAIYAKYAPEKLAKLPVLLERFRGYEKWLLMKIENKYEKDESSSEEDSSTESDESDEQEQLHAQHFKYHEEERILEGYDRIYPPKGHGHISPLRYRQMEEYIADVDYQQQRRLLCPLQQIRNNGDDIDTDSTRTVPQRRWSRADGWIGGNVHIRKASLQPKIIAPPTQKQIEFADRLSQGFSTGNTAASKTSLQQRKSRIINHDLIDAEANPFFHLTDRVSQAKQSSKETRQRAELRINRKINPPGVALRQQVVDLGLSNEQSCLRLGTEHKFYTKQKYQTNQLR